MPEVTSDLRTSIVRTHEAFLALEQPWRSLAERADASVFCTWEWQWTWWQFYGGDHELTLICAWEGQRLIGLLPVYVARQQLLGFLQMRELRLIGTGGDTTPDYMGPLIDPDRKSEIAELLVRVLLDAKASWDVARLSDMADSPILPLMSRGRRGLLRGRAQPSETIQIVKLPATWDEFVAKLHHDRRARVRQQRRKADQNLRAVLRVCTTGDELASAYEALVRLHRKRWSEKGADAGGFKTSAYVEFHRHAIERCQPHDWIRLYCLEIKGEIVAVLYCYKYRNEIFHFQSGFDANPDLEKYSIGQVLIGHAIESAIGEHAAVFDMLKGNHRYKHWWSNDVRVGYRIDAYRRSLGGLLALSLDGLRAMRPQLIAYVASSRPAAEH